LIDKISDLYAACIVVKKQSRKPKGVAKLAKLTVLNQGAERLLVKLMGSSEAIDPDSDQLIPSS
jgi:hypothetical protein